MHYYSFSIAILQTPRPNIRHLQDSVFTGYRPVSFLAPGQIPFHSATCGFMICSQLRDLILSSAINIPWHAIPVAYHWGYPTSRRSIGLWRPSLVQKLALSNTIPPLFTALGPKSVVCQLSHSIAVWVDMPIPLPATNIRTFSYFQISNLLTI